MKSVQFLVAALLLVASPVVLAGKPDPNVPNPPLQVLEYNVDADGWIAVHEQGTASVDIVDTEELDVNITNAELDVNVTGGSIDADVTGSIVKVTNEDDPLTPLMVSEGPFYGLKVAVNDGCNVNFIAHSVSAPCTPGGFAPIVIEQVSLVAGISGASEGVLFIQIRKDSTEYEHVVPLQSFGGLVFGTQLTRLYVPVGWSIHFLVQLDANVSGAARIDYSGYRVLP